MKTLLSLYSNFRFIRRYLGGEWVHVRCSDYGAMGMQNEDLWLRPSEVDEEDEVLGRESWPAREVRP